MGDLAAIGQTLSVWFLPFVIAITVHEAAHGYVADKLGDDTARRLGRVSFNPIRHIDLIGTILVPAMLVLFGSRFVFGWAKPVPVAFHRLGKPKRDMVWVAAAGPAVNLAMALVTLLVMYPVGQLEEARFTLWIWTNLLNFIWINVLLATFNMIPLPPLDGGRVLTGLLPNPWAYRFAQLEPYGIMALMLVAFIIPMVAGELGYDFNPLGAVVFPVAEGVQNLLFKLTGWA